MPKKKNDRSLSVRGQEIIDLTKKRRELIHDRLQSASIGIIREIHDIMTRQIQTEGARQAALDGKANSLLSSVGISISVALSGLVAIIPTISNDVILFCVAVSGIASLLFGSWATIKAYRAIKVTGDFRTVSHDDIFNENAIKLASSIDDLDAQVAAYRQYLIPQLEEIATNDYSVNNRKADLVLVGQKAFFKMILSLFFIAFFAVISKAC